MVILDSYHPTTLWLSYLTTAAKRITSAIVSIVAFSLLCVAEFRLVWSNFEIGDLDLWRGEAYSKLFDFLDEKGGFYYEVFVFISRNEDDLMPFLQRWGDAPVHSIGAALFAKKDQIVSFLKYT